VVREGAGFTSDGVSILKIPARMCALGCDEKSASLYLIFIAARVGRRPMHNCGELLILSQFTIRHTQAQNRQIRSAPGSRSVWHRSLKRSQKPALGWIMRGLGAARLGAAECSVQVSGANYPRFLAVRGFLPYDFRCCFSWKDNQRGGRRDLRPAAPPLTKLGRWREDDPRLEAIIKPLQCFETTSEL